MSTPDQHKPRHFADADTTEDFTPLQCLQLAGVVCGCYLLGLLSAMLFGMAFPETGALEAALNLIAGPAK